MESSDDNSGGEDLLWIRACWVIWESFSVSIGAFQARIISKTTDYSLALAKRQASAK
jgi:hypothetical protein